jgi:hypothetical protein
MRLCGVGAACGFSTYVALLLASGLWMDADGTEEEEEEEEEED